MQKSVCNHRQMADADIVQCAKAGDEAAFQELVRRHYDKAYRRAFSILRNEEDAQDETQNAFLNIWKSLGQFHGDSKFTTWMSRIVVNQCLMRLRNAKRAQHVYMDDASEGSGNFGLDLADPSFSPEQDAGHAELRGLLQHEIRRIPSILRTAFIRHYLDGAPIQQVAEELGLTLGATKSRLLRARTELRDRLGKHCGLAGPATLYS